MNFGQWRPEARAERGESKFDLLKQTKGGHTTTKTTTGPLFVPKRCSLSVCIDSQEISKTKREREKPSQIASSEQHRH